MLLTDPSPLRAPGPAAAAVPRAPSDLAARLRCAGTALRFAGASAVASTAYLVLAAAVFGSAPPAAEHGALVAFTCSIVFGSVYAATRRHASEAAELARCRRELVENERRARAAWIASSIAHDANNFLCALAGEIERRSAVAQAGDAPDLGRVRLCLEHLTALNRRLVDASAHPDGPDVRAIDVARAVDECVSALRYHPSVRGCAVLRGGERELIARADAVLVQQMVANLVLNAGEATHGRGTVEVRVARDGAHAIVEIHDDGPGLAPAARAAPLRSIESTKRRGGGFGLRSVWACADAIRARVEVDASPLGGALFRVRLPLAADREPA